MEEPISQAQIDHVVRSASAVGIIGNVLLSAFKLFAGLIGHSGAMLSDAVHSLSDVFATLIAFIGVKLAARGADSGHPYGHERMECVASLLLSAILFITGIGIGYTGFQAIRSAQDAAPVVPGVIALTAAIVSIVVKEAMFWYTRWCARRIRSSAFMADAWHHRSDALSSVGALIGIAGARLGYPILDPVASLVICLFILKIAFDICKDAIGKMTDSACPETFTKQLQDCIMNQEGVLGIDLLQTRQFGEKVYVDAEIRIDGAAPLTQAHDVAEQVHQQIEAKFPTVKHIMIHMNPEL